MYFGFILFFSTQHIFVASLTQSDKCGDNIEMTNADYLTSPGYPTAYPPSQHCMWVISAPEPSQKILINFNPHFDLEDRGCKYDYVEVFNGGDERLQPWGSSVERSPPPQSSPQAASFSSSLCLTMKPTALDSLYAMRSLRQGLNAPEISPCPRV
ncbi:hypothetical protein UPYG_G00289140 [Umbra pygmaea]|uniref:CUB domain-containing protein n=1 Tax=Umbra pygmaea TaxID=75934 RepID=A0ABD0W927_UMBPY